MYSKTLNSTKFFKKKCHQTCQWFPKAWRWLLPANWLLQQAAASWRHEHRSAQKFFSGFRRKHLFITTYVEK